MSRDNREALEIHEIPQDSTSTYVESTIVDKTGATIDLSVATGDLLFHARTQGGIAVVTGGVAAFKTDGTDGIVRFQATTALVGTVRDVVFEFEVQGYAGGNLVTKSAILRVMQRAKVV